MRPGESQGIRAVCFLLFLPPSLLPVKGKLTEPDALRSKSRRLWLFRILALVAVPALLLGLAELSLRVLGYGYPVDYFVTREIQGKEMLTENPRFGFRFFPPGLARSPLPTVLSPAKPEGVFRIFLFGESAALGDPRPAYGFGRYLEALLNGRFPLNRFEVVCVAMTAINSHVVLPIARECAEQDGDLWIIYMGNNEMIGPFGATGKLGAKVPSALMVRTSLAIQRTRLGQALEGFIRTIQGKSQESAWRGLDLFTGQEIPPDSPLRDRVEENFQANLKAILAEANRARVGTILCTVASSLKDCAPHASMHAAEFDQKRQTEWEDSFRRGTAALNAADFAEAADALQQANQLDPFYADARFHLGLARLRQEDRKGALNEFVAARDADALPFRTTSELNEITRKLGASGSDQILLLDLERELNEEGEVPGQDLFFDHVHFNFEGNYRIAMRLAEALLEKLPHEIKEADVGAWPEQLMCEQALGLTPWNEFLAYETMVARLSGPPYTNQLTNADSRKAHLQAMRDLREIARKKGEQSREVYLHALKTDPTDHYLHQNFAEFLELSGKTAEAIAEWQRVQELAPHHPAAYFHAGRLNVRQRQFKAAEEDLRQALSIRRDFPEALVELGKALSGQGTHEQARDLLQQALKINPANAEAHFALAESLGAAGRRNEAVEHLRAVVEINPAYWEAHYFLGVELALRGHLQGAERHFEQVVRLRPDNALGQLNYGVALARQQRFSDALVHFEKALSIDPGNEAARKHLETIKALLRSEEPQPANP